VCVFISFLCVCFFLSFCVTTLFFYPFSLVHTVLLALLPEPLLSLSDEPLSPPPPPPPASPRFSRFHVLAQKATFVLSLSLSLSRSLLLLHLTAIKRFSCVCVVAVGE